MGLHTIDQMHWCSWHKHGHRIVTSISWYSSPLKWHQYLKTFQGMVTQLVRQLATCVQVSEWVIKFTGLSHSTRNIFWTVKFHSILKDKACENIICEMADILCQRQCVKGPAHMAESLCSRSIWFSLYEDISSCNSQPSQIYHLEFNIAGVGITKSVFVNSLRPSDAYMHYQTKPSWVHMMACCLTGAKPLS